MFIPSHLRASKNTILSLLTAKEKAITSNSKEFAFVNVPVRVTLDKSNTSATPTVVRGDFDLPADDMNTVLGLDPVETDTHITLNGILTYSSNGFLRFSVTPVQGDQRDFTGTFFENFRLRSDYLRCPSGTKAGEKWTNGNGTAIIDIKTQEVLDINFTDNMIGTPHEGYEGKVIASDENTITVTCVMANGGVNFSGFIR